MLPGPRGLAHQNKTAVDRGTGTMTVRAVDEDLEARAVITPYVSARDRSKSGPTPRRRKTFRPAPGRRGILSPARPAGPAGQRPEGRARTGRAPLPAQRPGTTTRPRSAPSPPEAPHRARGAALGAGFHHGAHATPLTRAPHPQPAPDTGQLRIT